MKDKERMKATLSLNIIMYIIHELFININDDCTFLKSSANILRDARVMSSKSSTVSLKDCTYSTAQK